MRTHDPIYDPRKRFKGGRLHNTGIACAEIPIDESLAEVGIEFHLMEMPQQYCEQYKNGPTREETAPTVTERIAIYYPQRNNHGPDGDCIAHNQSY